MFYGRKQYSLNFNKTMDDLIELSSLGIESLDDIGVKKTTNFGGGIELLMNEKVRDAKPKSDIDIDDLTNLENELNDLSGGAESISFKPSVKFDDNPPSVGQATAETTSRESNNKTWDGYGKFNNIPVDPDKTMPATSSQPQLTKEELLREKFKFLRKLEALEKKGVELTKKYNMDSSLAEMQGEYEMIMEEKAKQNSVKFQGNMMMAIINGIEFLNNRFDPFDVKLDGWGEQINENITDYDEIFGELYEKYKTRASMAPELKLLFQLGGSAMMVHMTNTMFKSAMPGMDDILRQNPDLMRQFQTAAVNSMSQSSPGFSGFMSGIMEPPNNNGRGPPPPMATQGPNAVPPPYDRGGNNMSRPDLNMARSFVDDGINIRETSSNLGNNISGPPERSSRRSRPEMKGPSDIGDILSGLKTKTINIQQQQQQQFQQQLQQQQQSAIAQALDEPPALQSISINESSTISISDLKELQGSGNIPKRSKRRKGSDKNTISLDI